MESSVISGKTKICALIGDPIEHTTSPVIHNVAFKKLGLDYFYLPFRVRAEELSQAVDGLRALNIQGFNVTIPHKVTIIPMLDGLDPLAEKIGAVNTVVNTDGNLRGYNTDAAGFLQPLLERGIEPSGKDVVVLGAGGASRAISYILAERDAHLTILNRQLELDWAEELAHRIYHDFEKEVRVLELSFEHLATVLEGADILINATSVGMSPHSQESPVPAELLKSDLVVFDIVYNPVRTKLLKEAQAAGARTIEGIDMLVWQGALAFEKWTGQTAPFDVMRKEAIKALERYED
jgi:shikimate dehydrogenase